MVGTVWTRWLTCRSSTGSLVVERAWEPWGEGEPPYVPTIQRPYEQPPSFFLPPLTWCCRYRVLAAVVGAHPRNSGCTCTPLRQRLQEAHRRKKQAVSSPQNWSCLLFPVLGPIQRHTRSRQIYTRHPTCGSSTSTTQVPSKCC